MLSASDVGEHPTHARLTNIMFGVLCAKKAARTLKINFIRRNESRWEGYRRAILVRAQLHHLLTVLSDSNGLHSCGSNSGSANAVPNKEELCLVPPVSDAVLRQFHDYDLLCSVSSRSESPHFNRWPYRCCYVTIVFVSTFEDGMALSWTLSTASSLPVQFVSATARVREILWHNVASFV